MGVAVMFHLAAVVIWVGGMFFAYMALRPVAAAQLEPPARLRLWRGVFGRFFPWVWVSILTILVSGYWVIFADLGGMPGILHQPYIHVMIGLGSLMMFIFFYVFFGPYKRLARAVEAQNWEAGGMALGQIRQLVGINTLLGLLVIVIAMLGPYYGF